MIGLRDERYDAIVVGAGPAGSTAAWKLARAGVRVLLVDGSDFPRSKPCGEAISPGATPLLEEMGVLPRLRRAGAGEIRGFRLRTPEGRFLSGQFGAVTTNAADAEIPDVGLTLSRRRLDAVLLDAAIAAGADFRAPLRVFDVDAATPADPVRLRGRDGTGREVELAAPWVIGADGLRSVVARRVAGVRHGRRDRLAVVGRYRPAVAVASTASREAGELRLSPDGDGCCLGAAPIEDGLWTVAVVVPRGRAPAISADVFAFYRETIDAYGFAPPPAEASVAGGLEVTGPFEVSPRAVTAPGVLLAGDAAGYFDPFTGQGIYRALVTGRYAAAAVDAALAEPGRAAAERRAYARALDDLLVPGRRVQRVVDAFVSRPRLMNPVGRVLQERPGLLSLLLDVTGDRVPPGHLLRPGALWTAWRRRSNGG